RDPRLLGDVDQPLAGGEPLLAELASDGLAPQRLDGSLRLTRGRGRSARQLGLLRRLLPAYRQRDDVTHGSTLGAHPLVRRTIPLRAERPQRRSSAVAVAM